MTKEQDNVAANLALPVSNATNANLIITELALLAANVAVYVQVLAKYVILLQVLVFAPQTLKEKCVNVVLVMLGIIINIVAVSFVNVMELGQTHKYVINEPVNVNVNQVMLVIAVIYASLDTTLFLNVNHVNVHYLEQSLLNVVEILAYVLLKKANVNVKNMFLA